MVDHMLESEENYTRCLPPPTTNNQNLPTRAEMTKTQANSATTRAHLARAVDLEPPHLLVNKVTGRLELAGAAQKDDGINCRQPNGSTIVGK